MCLMLKHILKLCPKQRSGRLLPVPPNVVQSSPIPPFGCKHATIVDQQQTVELSLLSHLGKSNILYKSCDIVF